MEAKVEKYLSVEAPVADFKIHLDKLASIVSSYDIKTLQELAGVEGLASRLGVSLSLGVKNSDVSARQIIYGSNKYTEKPFKSFWTFLWEALQDITLNILMVCGVVSIGVGLATEGWPKGTYDRLGILLSIFLVVIVTAISDYKQSLQFRDLDKEKKNIFIQVTRDGSRHKDSVYDLVVGDLVHLSIGDLVPTDEIFVSGYSLLIDQSSLSVVTIIVVAVPERLPLAVTLSLAFAMKKLMDNKALVRHLSACETMGSATCICTDKTGTLTTNQMVVDKIWICEKTKKVEADIGGDAITLNISENALAFLLQAIFHNTGAKVVKDKDGKKSILGTPTESAILEYGMLVGGNIIPDSGYTLVAVVGIKDPVRPGVKNAVKTCLDAGITMRMVTGDNIKTAKAIAKECGILTADGLAIEGPEFRNKTPDEMRHIIPRIQVIARSLPMDKLVLINNLRGMFKEIAVVTGDGTNDAPALHEADIGFAMGIAGTEVAKESADIIVLDDNFSTIVSVAKWGRSVYIIFKSLCNDLSTHFTAVQLLRVNLIMDTLGAIALATEPPHDGLMSRPPVGREVSLISTMMWRNIIGQSTFQLAILLVFNFIGKQILRLEGSETTIVLSIFIFNTFVFCQVFNEINCRDMEKINVFRGIFGSWIFLGVIISIVVLQVVIVEFLGTFASTMPLSLELWLLSVLIGAVSLIVAVILKLITIEQRNTKHYDGYDLLSNGPELA
ncbi:hypothetical protein K7X08_007561 [Anisodus acutangulus]|uniref:Cation-transporting P-type ATPase N-terminal domain-containing protein n=1 Tax=Anisodus acutangulus TaxID=402998 RepID=A0A9Q1LEC3_9SOLA|nr:hypothetical protein K7X08_007561 [Anisodus acutangulus]